MTSKELIRRILGRLNKFKYLIVLGGVLVAGLLFMKARSTPAVYTFKSTLYPLTAGPDNSSASSKLNELIGGSNGSKTLSDEANVNIEEVARSKKTRDAVVAERLPEFGNKQLAVILIEDFNKYKSVFSNPIKIPTTNPDLYSVGASLLFDNYTVKFNKNSLLELYVSSKNEKLLQPISLILIDKISQFYKELKIKKAQFDFDFTQKKVDSLESVLKKYDNQRILLNNTTLFVQPGKLQYTVPKENLENNKLLVLAQRNGAASNREEALWRKQKVTPIIEILDRPAISSVQKPSKVIYACGGFVLGILLFSIFSIFGIVYKYLKSEINKKLADTLAEPQTTTTITTL